MASIEPEALRVLSLDGGGIKGYTSLIILQRIFRTLQDIKPCDPPLKPCQVFDLIVGTSTGGLIAIMLGRLEMSIEEAINQYEVVGQKVFGQRPFFGKFANAIAGAPFYDIHILQECVKDVLKEKNIAPDEDFIVKDGIPSCRVKVCVTSKITSNVDALRSYRSVHPTIVNYDCTIWEAASATSAAPVFFKYVKFRTGDEFFDGGLRRNNPVEEALNECRQEKDLKDRELGCLISIGTGFHKIEGISSSLSRLLKAAVRMITDSQDTADRFLRSDEGLKLESSGRYFRFNVPQGMEDLRMDEHKETVRMRALTENYLHKMENGRMVAKCAEVLSKSDKLCSKADSPRKIKLHLDEIGTHYRLSCEECLKSLRFPMMDQWRRPSRESTSGTCSWLFQHKIFQDWLQCRDVQTHSGLIWISGKPGSGKSTLMLEAYRHVSKLQEPNKYCTAAFFFSAKTDSEQSNLLHSPEGLYRSLLHQLLPHHEEGLRRVVEAYKEKLTGVSSYKGYAVSWPEEELRKLFQSLFDESFAPRTVIFVDAMDECDSNRVRELAFFFRGLANRANLKGRKLDVCFSSTRVAVVNLGNCPSIVVEENNELDILLYLEENFVCDGTNNPRDFISLKNKIAEISSGVFLWVVLVVDLLLEELDKGRNIKYLEDERLPEVPRRLQDLFRDILSRIKEEDREISLHFFQWAILAGELRLKEWRHIFPFIGCHKPLSFAKATQSKLYSKTDEQLEKQIRHVSMGLFEVVGKTGQASSEGTDIDHDSIIGDAGSLNSDIGDTRVVDAIHLSVREFFVREGGFQILSPGLGFNAIGKGYISIMDTCLDYIGIQEFDCLERARQGTTSSLSSSSDSLGGVCDREQFRQLKHVKVFRRPAAKFDGESDESLHPLEIKVQYITGKLTTQRSRTICRSDVPLVYLGDFYYLRPSG
ncbi:Calcium-independent phospholipase A2-gamma [Daldinia childiae]|uniref:Calcium-independent phospholipase A2-gamma n=1 Tax=Daldinia childiae TaxID=326645 RepID=UPI0014451378|nr:Calcium-independent phospholipase A2-gamma [Daldinia childiae]KAF3062293.1 Calcium-independent phospholipase A2-gamma [Daldinia childiae]